MKQKLFSIFSKFQKKPKKERKPHSERYLKTVAFFNKYSLLFHALLACTIVFIVEIISRRNFFSACTFAGGHTLAFLYNAFIVFSSLTLVYLFRRRAFWRVIISGFWLFLGIINGCVLSNRVTPFGYTDLKCIPDLLSMKDSSYFTAQQATLAVVGVCAFIGLCVLLFIKGPRFEGRLHKIGIPLSVLAFLMLVLPLTTNVVQSTHIVESYFSNIAQGYEDYGFVYGFSSSVVDRGMDKPSGYSQSQVDNINEQVANASEETNTTYPNIICVLLESFCDPDEIKFLNYNEDPVPTFHELEKNFTSGYLTVPVVGAGTANSEFEMLTGMNMKYFGTGEYPYKTILKQSTCESIASVLSSIGYGTHAVHNNGGNFYSRVNAFSMMGFDSFTSKEMMNIVDYTPKGNWPEDAILVSETIKTLTSTPDKPDFTYTITVGSHGDYPTEAIIENPPYTISGVEDEGVANQWTYYVNQLNKVDSFIANLIASVEKLQENTVIVFFGDHLPTMGLSDEDMVSGDIYKTKYVTWNNMGLPKEDADLYAYQLLADTLDRVNIHEGTIMKYHQTMADTLDFDSYLAGLENLQYDLLYGSRYTYKGEDLYPATDIVMGVNDVTIEDTFETYEGNKVMIRGTNFTKWSKVYINGEKVPTTYVNGYTLTISKSRINHGDVIVVNQLGSSNTIFRSSNEFIYEDEALVRMMETELDELLDEI